MNYPTQKSSTTYYTQDIAGGLSQVLSDGENLYTYGYNRIAQVNDDTTGYFLDDVLGSVRQVVDADSEIVLGREYSPYGETISSTGDFDTDFGYTGELTDGTGLVNLRARFYDPGTGRFITRDSWAGDYLNPMSTNKWSYVDGNPISRIDPSGFYWWGPGEALYDSSLLRYQSQNIHTRIQAMVMFGNEELMQAEYPIPPLMTKVDLLDSQSGEIWEIKPWADENQAILELSQRIIYLEDAQINGLLKGTDPIGLPYDWNYNPVIWIEGYSINSEFFVGTDETGQYQIWAGQVSPGIILWWKYKNPSQVPDDIPLFIPDSMKYSDRNVRQNWSPKMSPGLQPAYSPFLDTNEIVLPIVVVTTLALIYKFMQYCANSPIIFVLP